MPGGSSTAADVEARVVAEMRASKAEAEAAAALQQVRGKDWARGSANFVSRRSWTLDAFVLISLMGQSVSMAPSADHHRGFRTTCVNPMVHAVTSKHVCRSQH